MKPNRFSLMFLLAAGLSLFASLSVAQELIPESEPTDMAVLSQLIDWGGIFRAVVIILVAWLLLRFVDRIVDNLGKSIAEHRLAFQRINAFFHFFRLFDDGCHHCIVQL